MEKRAQRAARRPNCAEDPTSGENACLNREEQKGKPFFWRGEFWGLLVALLLFVTVFITALMR